MKNQKNNPDQKSNPDQNNNPDKTGQRQDPQAQQGSKGQQGAQAQEGAQAQQRSQEQRGEMKERDQQRGQDDQRQQNQSGQNDRNIQKTYEEDQSLGNQSLEDQSMRAGGTPENRGSLEQTERQERSKPNPGAAHEHAEESEENLEDLSLKGSERNKEGQQ